ncbi:hypothetical protein Fcan01_23265 [Folsomia candida]|uniref:CCHC-type domain-containing protein n=1 Tax=Folsomia candida TaxID=158441 RepID=A0A226DBG6_FOLCA|nr:hypothetical protein Fcan01_23265 [Folsomia candida]
MIPDDEEVFMDSFTSPADGETNPDLAQSKSFSQALGSQGQISQFSVNSAHGIVLRRIRDVSLLDVLKGLARFVDPKSITHADSLGPANWAIWFIDQAAFDVIIKADTIKFGAASVKVYAYANPIRRVIVRGVPPFLPDEILINSFAKYGEIRGQVSHQSIFGAGEEFAHIISFTRILNLAIPKGIRVPDSINVKVSDKVYKLRVQIGAKKCFRCGKKNHVSANCTAQAKKSLGQRSAPLLSIDPTINNSNIVSRKNDAPVDIGVRTSTSSFKRPRVNDSQESSVDEVFESDGDSSQRSSSQSSNKKAKGRPKTISDWGYDKWNSVNLEIKSVTKDRFILFLRSLRREDNNNIESKYINLGQEIFMTTKVPKDIETMLVEVHSSIPSSNKCLVTKYASLLSQIREFLESDPAEFKKCQALLDNNYRQTEWQSYCRLNSIPLADQDGFKAFFFNIKW